MDFCHSLPKVSRQYFALTIIALLIVPSMLLVQLTSAANPPEPTYASANMNGDPSEWNLNIGGDFFAYMYRAGNISKPIESNASLRYDCSTQTLYVLVMTAPGVPAIVSPTDAWGAINNISNKVFTGNSGNGSSLPAFVWVGQGFDGNSSHAQGYEAAFSLAPGNYTLILHLQVEDGGSQTSATTGFPLNGIPLVIICTPTPSISVVKMISTDNATWYDANTPPGITVPAGSDVYYQFNVTNTGNVTLSDITLTDSLYSISPTPPGTLAPNVSYLYYYGPVTAQAGLHTNTATATGTVNNTLYSDTNDANYNATTEPNPSISVIKWVSCNNITWVDANTPPGLIVTAGSNIYFKFEITNTGNVALSDITLEDNTYQLSNLNLPTTLEPNATFTYYLGPLAAQKCQHTNTATATGTYNNTVYSDTDNANYFGTQPAKPCITIKKYISINGCWWVDANYAPGLIVQAKKCIYFKLIIKNTGNVLLTNITLEDNNCLNLPCGSIPSQLEPGQCFTVTSGPIKAEPFLNCNCATGSGTYNNVTCYDSDHAFYYGFSWTFCRRL